MNIFCWANIQLFYLYLLDFTKSLITIDVLKIDCNYENQVDFSCDNIFCSKNASRIQFIFEPKMAISDKHW